MKQALSTVSVAQQTVYEVKTPDRTIQGLARSVICGKDLGRIFLYHRGLYHVSTTILTMKRTSLRMMVDARHFCCFDANWLDQPRKSSRRYEWLEQLSVWLLILTGSLWYRTTVKDPHGCGSCQTTHSSTAFTSFARVFPVLNEQRLVLQSSSQMTLDDK